MNSKNYFDRVATRWDQMRREFFSENVRETAFAVAKLQKGKLAADIGAGTGFITEGLLRRGLRVIAVDQSQEMIAVMKEKFKVFPRVDYRPGESTALPIEDNTVDYVFANMYLHHVQFPPAAIKEMARILKPGGKLIITDLDEHEFEFLRSEQHDRWLGFKREDLQRWFTRAGLSRVKVECVGEDCCCDSSCDCESIQISIFVASGEK